MTDAPNGKLTDPAFLRRVQAGSGIFLSSYMALHIPTTISGITGPYGYNEALKVFRHYYQHPVVEISLAASLIAHVVAGVALYRQREARSLKVKEPLHTVLTRWTGRIIGLIIPIHATATRIAPLLGLQRAADFDQVRTTFQFPLSLFFIPYYALLASSGIYHTAQGLILALSRFHMIPLSWYQRIAQHKVTYVAISSVVFAAFIGMYGLATKDGIPESSRYWHNQLPSFLQRSNSLSQF